MIIIPSAKILDLSYPLLKIVQNLVAQLEKYEKDETPIYASSALSLLNSKLDRIQSLSFSGANNDDLMSLDIAFVGPHLLLKSDLRDRIIAIRRQDDGHLSSKFWNGHLYAREMIFSNSGEQLTDAFMLRVVGMIQCSPNKKPMIDMVDNILSSTSRRRKIWIVVECIDDEAVAATGPPGGIPCPLLSLASRLHQPMIPLETDLDSTQLIVVNNKPPEASFNFFVLEVKVGEDMDIIVPQAVCELYARGKSLHKRFLRGALSNGHTWIFIIVKFSDNDTGASYMRSEPVKWRSMAEGKEGDIGNRDSASDASPDLVSGIFLHWIENSFSDIGKDDWFSDCSQLLEVHTVFTRIILSSNVGRDSLEGPWDLERRRVTYHFCSSLR